METPKNLLGNPPIKPQLKNDNQNPQRPPKSGEEFSVTLKVIIFLVVILVGALVLWFVLGNNRDNNEQTNNNTGQVNNNNNNVNNNNSNNDDVDVVVPPNRAPAVTVPGVNGILANDQASGNSVEVTMITISETGWVAIHEDREGSLGNVLGAGRFEPGIHLGEIQLLRNTVPGGTYYAVIYKDDGDRTFDMSKDAPIKDDDGRVISSTFKTN